METPSRGVPCGRRLPPAVPAAAVPPGLHAPVRSPDAGPSAGAGSEKIFFGGGTHWEGSIDKFECLFLPKFSFLAVSTSVRIYCTFYLSKLCGEWWSHLLSTICLFVLALLRSPPQVRDWCCGFACQIRAQPQQQQQLQQLQQQQQQQQQPRAGFRREPTLTGRPGCGGLEPSLQAIELP